MPERDDPALDEFEQDLAKRKGQYELPNDLISCSDHETLLAIDRPVRSEIDRDPISAHTHKQRLTDRIRAHTQIYVVNEQIIHGKNTWSTSLCAFDNLHSANTEARTHAILQHAKGDPSKIHVYWRNGCGTWTTSTDTDRGRIVKSVFVNATVLQHLATPPIDGYEERPAPGDRIIPSKVPGSQRVSHIQAFRSTDSIRIEVEQSNCGAQKVESSPTRSTKPALRENINKKNQTITKAQIMVDGIKGQGDGTTGNFSNEDLMHERNSIGDLRDFASLHILF